MEPIPGAGVRSSSGEREKQGVADESLRLGEEIRGLMISGPPETGSSFTALLGLPPDRAMELLHSSDSISTTSPPVLEPPPYAHSFAASSPPSFPPNAALLERAGRFSIFAGVSDNSPETSSVSTICGRAKNEPAAETESNPNSSSPLTADPKLGKRKEREKKVRVSTKKSKSVAYNESSDDTEKLPYVHVRARRGEATDSHSLAERARREKINARMKLLQELVPGCNKISGTALVLDEIISHVQSLQRQVELLSMRLAVVNPRIDFNLDSLWAAENLSQMDCNFPAMVMPLMLPDVQMNGNRQQSQQLWHMDAHRPVWGRGEDNHNFVHPENSLLSYDSLANSVSVHSNQLKMEL